MVEIFHVFGGGSNKLALKMLYRPVSILISAYSYLDKRNGLRSKNMRKLIREKSAILLVDSGLISAVRQGRGREWLRRQDLVLAAAEELEADRVAHLDVPMVPAILKSLGITAPEALEITIANAAEFMKAKTRASKGLVIQGTTPEDYLRCLRAYQDVDFKPGWWGIGSLLGRRRADVLDIVSTVRSAVQGHLHCFGITRPSLVATLAEMGCDSFDSSSAATKAGYGLFLLPDGREVSLTRGRLDRNSRMSALQFLYNIEALEYGISTAKAMNEDSWSRQLVLNFGTMPTCGPGDTWIPWVY